DRSRSNRRRESRDTAEPVDKRLAAGNLVQSCCRHLSRPPARSSRHFTRCALRRSARWGCYTPPGDWCSVPVPPQKNSRGNAMISARRFLALAACAAALVGLPAGAASAADYPTRPVHIVVGFPPGQNADIGARLIGDFLSRKLGVPFIIDNKPGAASTIGTEYVVHAAPDGYTLLWVVTSNYINASLYKKLPYDFIRDIAPIACSTITPLVMEVTPSLPVKTVPEFIAYAKAHPGKVNMASGGIGNSTHLGGELFQMMSGVKLTHVPYRGSTPAITDLMSGRSR